MINFALPQTFMTFESAQRSFGSELLQAPRQARLRKHLATQPKSGAEKTRAPAVFDLWASKGKSPHATVAPSCVPRPHAR